MKQLLNWYVLCQVTGNEEASDVPQTLEQIEENVSNWNDSDDEPDHNEETLENVDDEPVTTWAVNPSSPLRNQELNIKFCLMTTSDPC